MENTIEYVLYKNVKDNEYINRIRPIDDSVKKLKKTSNGVTMEVFYNFAPYKNIKTLYELSDALKDDEYLIIDLTQIKKDDEQRKDNNKLYDKIKETIDPSVIIPYVYHDLENKKQSRPIGEKLYLIKYDELSKAPSNIVKSSILVQLKMDKDQTCSWESISFSRKHKRQLDDELSYHYGGYSGLYYLIPEEEKDELDSYYEITKVEDGKWDFIKKNKDKSK